jgi:glycosyltransferase involved in cell wall biosynthesis
MRIAFTVHKFPPESLGGTEIYAQSLARVLAAEGHSVHVYYPLAGVPQEERQTEREGVHLWRAPLPSRRPDENLAAQYWHTFRDAEIERDFSSFLQTVGPDLVHFQHVQGVSARLIEIAAGLPRVVTLHDYWYFCANSQLIRPDRDVCSGPEGGWKCVDCATARADLTLLRALRPVLGLPFAYRNAYLRRALSGVDAFVAPSHFLRAQYAAQGFPAEKIRVLENGVDMERLVAGEEKSFPPPPARPHFGFLGSLAWQKGVHVLVEAFNGLPMNAALTIYGSPHSFPDYAKALLAAARHPHIRFAGAINSQQVGAALRQLDCLIVPSIWYENSPLVIQEAYAVGLPVIASRLGALPEKVLEGRTGFLFAPGDASDLGRLMGELIEQPGRLASLASHLEPGPTMRHHAGLLLDLYSSLRADH